MNRLILLVLVLLTASCNLQPIEEIVTVKDKLGVGSTLRLTQELVIPKERTFIYIANGKVAPLKGYNAVDIYKPYCMFFLHDEVSQRHVISPGNFEVTKVIEWEGYYSSLNYMNVANRFQPSGKFIKVDGDRGAVMYATIISLRSEKHPEVKEIVCGHWDDYYRIVPLSFKQLEAALGDLISIDIANKKSKNGKFI